MARYPAKHIKGAWRPRSRAQQIRNIVRVETGTWKETNNFPAGAVFASACVVKQKEHRLYLQYWNKTIRKGQQLLWFQAVLNKTLTLAWKKNKINKKYFSVWTESWQKAIGFIFLRPKPKFLPTIVVFSKELKQVIFDHFTVCRIALFLHVLAVFVITKKTATVNHNILLPRYRIREPNGVLIYFKNFSCFWIVLQLLLNSFCRFCSATDWRA